MTPAVARRLASGPSAPSAPPLPEGELLPVRGALRKQSCRFAKAQPVAFLKRCLTDRMLFMVVFGTEADHPSVRRLEADSSISSVAHMRAFYRQKLAAWNRAMVASDPGTMGRAAPRRTQASSAGDAGRQPTFKHSPDPWPRSQHFLIDGTGWLGTSLLVRERFDCRLALLLWMQRRLLSCRKARGVPD